MRYRVPFLVALVGLALVACDDPPTEPEDGQTAVADYANSENPNAAIVRHMPEGCGINGQALGYTGFIWGALYQETQTSSGVINRECTGAPIPEGFVPDKAVVDRSFDDCILRFTPSGLAHAKCQWKASLSVVPGKAPVNQVSAGGTVDWPAGRVTYGINAQISAADAVKGQLQFHGRDVDISGHGTLTCMYVEDNTAFLGGEWTSSTDENLVGTEFLVGVQDNGEGSNATGPDQISSISIYTTASNCLNGWTIPFMDWTNGNVQLK